MQKSAFHLVVYPPESETTPLGQWPLAAPIHFSVGDVIKTFHIDPDARQTSAVRISRIEHILSPREGSVTHVLELYTCRAEPHTP